MERLVEVLRQNSFSKRFLHHLRINKLKVQIQLDYMVNERLEVESISIYSLGGHKSYV